VVLIEFPVNLSARHCIEVLEGSDDLCADEKNVALILSFLELRKLVLEDFVETAVFTTTWNSHIHEYCCIFIAYSCIFNTYYLHMAAYLLHISCMCLAYYA
jgi:hypothetical protein